MEQIVSEYQDGSNTQREIAERHGIGVGTLRNWLRRSEASGSSCSEQPWIEVVAEAADRPMLLLAEVQVYPS